MTRNRKGGIEQEEYVSSAEVGAESVQNVLNILGDKSRFPWITEIEESEAFSEDDRDGIDLMLTLEKEMALQTGYKKLAIQIKSSETGIADFVHVGMHRFGGYSLEEWNHLGMIVLNGQWTVESIEADFISQLLSQMGITRVTDEVEDFYKTWLVPDLVTSVRRGQLIIAQYREDLIAWVTQDRTKFRPDQNGSPVWYL